MCLSLLYAHAHCKCFCTSILHVHILSVLSRASGPGAVCPVPGAVGPRVIATEGTRRSRCPLTPGGTPCTRRRSQFLIAAIQRRRSSLLCLKYG
jgi:hypothetical protein